MTMIANRSKTNLPHRLPPTVRIGAMVDAITFKFRTVHKAAPRAVKPGGEAEKRNRQFRTVRIWKITFRPRRKPEMRNPKFPL
jgi:hypothetical protein